MKFLAVTVLFKVPPSQAETLTGLAAAVREFPDCRVIVWDNSPVPASDEELARLRERFAAVEYRATPDNWPLSRIYNAVIEEKVRCGAAQYEYLVLFDQDSEVPTDFLVRAAAAGVQFPGPALLLPLVWANGTLVSPSDLRYFRGRLWRQPRTGLVRARHRSAINSGMVIRISYLREEFPGYDTRLQFYGTDCYFVQAYAETQEWFAVFDCHIHHDLSQNRREPREVVLWRHADLMNAMCLLNEQNAVRRIAARLYCFGFSVKRALERRDAGFLKWFSWTASA